LDEKTHKPWLEAFVHNVEQFGPKNFSLGSYPKLSPILFFKIIRGETTTFFLKLCLICLKGQQFYGGSHKNTFQYYFSKKKEEQHKVFSNYV
jgi:hypothetical protein